MSTQLVSQITDRGKQEMGHCSVQTLPVTHHADQRPWAARLPNSVKNTNPDRGPLAARVLGTSFSRIPRSVAGSGRARVLYRGPSVCPRRGQEPALRGGGTPSWNIVASQMPQNLPIASAGVRPQHSVFWPLLSMPLGSVSRPGVARIQRKNSSFTGGFST